MSGEDDLQFASEVIDLRIRTNNQLGQHSSDASVKQWIDYSFRRRTWTPTRRKEDRQNVNVNSQHWNISCYLQWYHLRSKGRKKLVLMAILQLKWHFSPHQISVNKFVQRIRFGHEIENSFLFNFHSSEFYRKNHVSGIVMLKLPSMKSH